MNSEPIRVLLVDDSMLVSVLLERILSMPGTGIKVVGKARDGADALQKIPLLRPQVICTDLQMPRMSGLELTREVMASNPMPILVLSSAVEKGKDDGNVFKLLEAGALDVLPKPKGSLNGDLAIIGKDLIAKIKMLAGVVAFTRHQRPVETPTTATTRSSPFKPAIGEDHGTSIIPQTTRVLAIGASTGGPHALHQILSGLSPKLPFPVVCVQHVSEGFTEDLIDWLGVDCPLQVRVAKVGERLAPGTVYFPPDTSNLVLDRSGCCSVTTTELVACNSRPCITFTFNTIAQYYGSATVGILLTGMGADGADGLLNIRKAGGVTIAQDEASCVVYGMPKVAAEIGAAKHVLPLAQIAQILKNYR